MNEPGGPSRDLPRLLPRADPPVLPGSPRVPWHGTAQRAGAVSPPDGFLRAAAFREGGESKSCVFPYIILPQMQLFLSILQSSLGVICPS